jgi:hypothetical protein
MTDSNTNKPNFKVLHYNIDPKLVDQPIEQHPAAAGDVNNEKLKTCFICKNNGWPREAISFERINGRCRSDGTNEVKGWIIREYFTGREHAHREPRIAGDTT